MARRIARIPTVDRRLVNVVRHPFAVSLNDTPDDSECRRQASITHSGSTIGLNEARILGEAMVARQGVTVNCHEGTVLVFEPHARRLRLQRDATGWTFEDEGRQLGEAILAAATIDNDGR